MSDGLGQQLVIENRPGASSNIATEAVVRAPADGYTLFMGTIANTINASLYSKLPFDFARDLRQSQRLHRCRICWLFIRPFRYALCRT